jgi:hypothetical protein
MSVYIDLVIFDLLTYDLVMLDSMARFSCSQLDMPLCLLVLLTREHYHRIAYITKKKKNRVF